MTPDVTQRELYSKLDRAKGGLGAGVKPRTRDDANNSYVNIEKEVIAKGRAPTKSNFVKGPVWPLTPRIGKYNHTKNEDFLTIANEIRNVSHEF